VKIFEDHTKATNYWHVWHWISILSNTTSFQQKQTVSLTSFTTNIAVEILWAHFVTQNLTLWCCCFFLQRWYLSEKCSRKTQTIETRELYVTTCVDHFTHNHL